MDNKDALLRPLRICAFCAYYDNSECIGSWPLDVVCKFVPFGSYTWGPFGIVVGF